MDSDFQHKDAVNQKTNGDTVIQWINPLREIGIQVMNDQNAGRSSVPDNRAGGWRVDGSASSIQERSQFELHPERLLCERDPGAFVLWK